MEILAEFSKAIRHSLISLESLNPASLKIRVRWLMKDDPSATDENAGEGKNGWYQAHNTPNCFRGPIESTKVQIGQP